LLQRREARAAVGHQHCHFAVDDRVPGLQLLCGFGDGREDVRPVLTAAADETRALLVDHAANAVTVVLDLVEPTISAGWLAPERRELRVVLGVGHRRPIVAFLSFDL